MLGKGALLNWGGVLTESEFDYNLWHSIEHMPERMNVNGFFRAIRCLGLKNTSYKDKYFMMYDVKNKDVLKSKEYLDTLKKIEKLSIPKFLFDGNYLKEHGMKEGILIGKTLKIIENEWINNEFKISNKRVLEIIKKNN